MNVCHVLMAIDASGSMYPLADDVRGGFNEYLDGLAADTDTTYYITTALFDTRVQHLSEATPLAATPRLTEENYRPGGGTALLDAIGDLVTAALARDDAGHRHLVVVNTDGQENSSQEWKTQAVRALIDSTDKERWGFVFVGAGPDVWQQGRDYGFASTRSSHSGVGTRSLYSSMVTNTTSYARGGASAQSVADNVGADSMAADQEGTPNDAA